MWMWMQTDIFTSRQFKVRQRHICASWNVLFFVKWNDSTSSLYRQKRKFWAVTGTGIIHTCRMYAECLYRPLYWLFVGMKLTVILINHFSSDYCQTMSEKSGKCPSQIPNVMSSNCFFLSKYSKSYSIYCHMTQINTRWTDCPVVVCAL